MKVLFLDAGPELAAVLERVRRADDPPVAVNLAGDLDPGTLPGLLRGVTAVLDDHTALPVDVVRRCPDLRHVVFLGTGARSYMDPEALAGLGVAVHLVRGYGDTAVAEHAFALMWAAARGLAGMDRAMRRGEWRRTEGVQLTGRTLGLVGFGGIAAELARLAAGIGMRVLAWNRSPRPPTPGVAFVDLPTLLAESHVVSLHLLLADGTRGFLGADRLAAMRPGAILVNTARGALVDEAALATALDRGQLAHAALDVFAIEPLPAGHPLAARDDVTLSAHSAFRTPEAAEALLRGGLDHLRRIAAGTGVAAGSD